MLSYTAIFTLLKSNEFPFINKVFFGRPKSHINFLKDIVFPFTNV